MLAVYELCVDSLEESHFYSDDDIHSGKLCVDSLEESHFYSDDDIHSGIQVALEQLVLYLHITNDWNNHDS